jgi:hypothetical protein
MGNAMGHANIPSQSFTYASCILNVDNAAGLVETSNTLYRLGQPDEAYKAWRLAASDSTLTEQNQKNAA